MYRTLSAVIMALPFHALAHPCAVTEEQMTGAWESTGEAGYFQQMAFTRESGVNTFDSWLHDRPELIGARWSLERCRLEISSPLLADQTRAFRVRMNGENALELHTEGEGSATYRRLESP